MGASECQVIFEDFCKFLFKFQEDVSILAGIAELCVTAQAECHFRHSHFISKCIMPYNVVFVKTFCKGNYCPGSKSCGN